MRARVGEYVRNNLVAFVALFVALGGTATAATVIITSADQVGTGTIASRAILDRSVTAVDVARAEAWRSVGAAGQPAWNTYDCGSGKICEFKNGGGLAPTQFSKDVAGNVHLRLNMCWSTRYNYQAPGSGPCSGYNFQMQNQTSAFRLPAGYRPASNLEFASNEVHYGRVVIGSGGSVLMGGECSFQSCVPSAFQLEIVFRADQ